MNFHLIGLDLCPEIKTEIKNIASAYNANFKTYSKLEQLEQLIESNIHQPVVVVLNVNANQNAKYLFTTNFRNHANTYFIFTSDEFNLDDRVRWLAFGANGYLKKPYHAEELLILATSLANTQTIFTLQDANFAIDLERNTVHYNNQQIYLTPTPFKVLTYLVHNSGQIVSRKELVDNLFNDSDDISQRKIDTYIKLIRHQTCKDIIKTVRGQGYLYQPISINNEKVQN